jgi:peptidoglycan/LPS O-acetylase OafA/YrhL
MRTLPAYYATLALVALGGVVIPRHTPWEHPWAYLIFLQNYLSIGSSFNWSWSLCVEEQFYLALPLLLIGARKLFPGARAVTLVRIVALAAFVVTLSARMHAGATADLSDWDKYMRELYAVTHCRLDGLAIGLFAATLPAFSLQWVTAGALLVGGFTCWTAMMLGLGWRPLTENLFATAGTGALLLALLGRPSWMAARFPGAAFVSELSYGLYLLQPVAFEVTMRALPTTVPSLVRAFAAIAASVVSAYAMRRGLELPALRLRDRLFIEEPVGATTGG